MNKTLQEGIELTQEINKRVKTAATDSVLVVLGTPFIHLSEANKNIDAPQIKIAAQNCATEPSGAL